MDGFIWGGACNVELAQSTIVYSVMRESESAQLGESVYIAGLRDITNKQ